MFSKQVKNKTKGSHVSQFGDIRMATKEYTSEFQGQKQKDANFKLPDLSNERKNAIRSDEVEFHLTKIYSDLNKGS